jgi:hypothetical protein
MALQPFARSGLERHEFLPITLTTLTACNLDDLCDTARTTPTRKPKINSTAVMTPAWIVYAWPPILWQASRAPQLHLMHLGTRVLNLGDEGSPCTGQTLWGEETEDRSAGVAWDWVRLLPGVVAMSDPLGLITNLKLLDDQGEALTNLEAAVRLHQLVHALPWQNEVQRALSEVAS